VPDEITSRLTAVESRLAAHQQPEVSAVPDAVSGQDSTSLKDKVSNWRSQ